MTRKFSLTLALLLFVAAGMFILVNGNAASADAPQQAIAAQLIAREKSSFEAWQRKDKAFFADFLADDATMFSGFGPYLETEPKVNFLPKFEQYAEMIKFHEFQMYNPRVQVYGDTAVLTYNSSIGASIGGQPMQYTAKVTSVYVKQGNTWRIVHSHESMNPGMK